jgi:predicted alpha/beta-fold hydrolase
LTADIEAALKSPELREARTIDLFGYSIGGHIALRYACAPTDSRVRRVAAVGSPVDLRAAADDFDAQGFNVYRSHVLDSLKEIHTAAYQRRPVGMRPDRARQISKIRDWDEQIIAPRFGFEGADHYYATQSAGPHLDRLQIDAIYVGASYDPMVKASAVHPHLEHDRITAVWEQGAGHLGFRADFDLGLPGPRGLESQVLSWLSR